MKEMSKVKTDATTESAGQFYNENRISNRKNLNLISSYLRGIFRAIRAICTLVCNLRNYSPHIATQRRVVSSLQKRLKQSEVLRFRNVTSLFVDTNVTVT